MSDVLALSDGRWKDPFTLQSDLCTCFRCSWQRPTSRGLFPCAAPSKDHEVSGICRLSPPCPPIQNRGARTTADACAVVLLSPNQHSEPAPSHIHAIDTSMATVSCNTEAKGYTALERVLQSLFPPTDLTPSRTSP